MNVSKRKREDTDDDLHDEEMESIRAEITTLTAEITALYDATQKLTEDDDSLMSTIRQSSDKDPSKDRLWQRHEDNQKSILANKNLILANKNLIIVKENLILANKNLILEKEKQKTAKNARLTDQLHAASQEGVFID
jgi:organic radical activating enzyme